jgi:hypothetical protein
MVMHICGWFLVMFHADNLLAAQNYSANLERGEKQRKN